jgi:hypothetical protein
MTERGLGCYAYCVVDAEGARSLDGIDGVDADFSTEAVTLGDLRAVVSRVRLDEFGAEPLRRNLEDLRWVERTARAHDAVLARALAADAVIPLRLCTVFTDVSHVRDMLEREGELLRGELGRLRGHAEWSVKLLAHRDRLEATARKGDPALAASSAGSEQSAPGRAFFDRRKVERSVGEEARTIAEGAAEELHARLRDEAAAATLLRPQNPELSRRSGEMILNGAYLVHRSRSGEFEAVAEALRGPNREIGLELDLSGPWAPYNFVTPPEAQGDDR